MKQRFKRGEKCASCPRKKKSTEIPKEPPEKGKEGPDQYLLGQKKRSMDNGKTWCQSPVAKKRDSKKGKGFLNDPGR